jgi:hypothetical protein
MGIAAKRSFAWLAGLYLLFAVIGRFVEGMGAVESSCAEDCWCKRPVLSTFRWVVPLGHRDPALPTTTAAPSP